MRYLSGVGLVALAVLIFAGVHYRPADDTTCDEKAAYCQTKYPECEVVHSCTSHEGCDDNDNPFRCGCPAPETCQNQRCGQYVSDLAVAGETPICSNGMITCDPGYTFLATPTLSGCFTDGTTLGGEINPPYDNPMGTCAGIGDVVVQCQAGCSFCMKPNAAIPPGCHICDNTNPCR
jgi:hypothetical protein